jgi:hypothetical protein
MRAARSTDWMLPRRGTRSISLFDIAESISGM